MWSQATPHHARTAIRGGFKPLWLIPGYTTRSWGDSPVRTQEALRECLTAHCPVHPLCLRKLRRCRQRPKAVAGRPLAYIPFRILKTCPCASTRAPQPTIALILRHCRQRPKAVAGRPLAYIPFRLLKTCPCASTRAPQPGDCTYIVTFPLQRLSPSPLDEHLCESTHRAIKTRKRHAGRVRESKRAMGAEASCR